MKKYDTEFGLPTISRRLLGRAINELEKEQSGELLTPNINNKCASLTTAMDRDLLQQTIIARDEANNGMTRSEMFSYL